MGNGDAQRQVSFQIEPLHRYLHEPATAAFTVHDECVPAVLEVMCTVVVGMDGLAMHPWAEHGGQRYVTRDSRRTGAE
jgi:hypothetical protein